MRYLLSALAACVALAGCAMPSHPVSSIPPLPPPAPVKTAAAVPSGPAPDAVVSEVVPQPLLEPCTGGPTASSATTFIKGQTHIHTERSFDAGTPVPDVLKFYQKHGYDFVAITDHNHVTAAKLDGDMLVIPGVELTYNASQCEPLPRPGYLCSFHSNVLFLNPMRDVTRGRYFNLPFRKHSLEVIEGQIRRAEDLEGILVLNHPTFQFAVDAELLTAVLRRGIRLVEFFNGAVIDRHPDGPTAAVEEAEALWDAVLSQGLLVYAVGGDDAHHFADAAWMRQEGKKPLVPDRAWIQVRAHRDPAAIRTAIVAGDFYVSTGVTLAALALTKKHVHVTVAPRGHEQYVTQFIGRDGHILARVEGTEACYPIDGTEGYVRAVVMSDAGHAAWTQPVMLDVVPAPP